MSTRLQVRIRLNEEHGSVVEWLSMNTRKAFNSVLGILMDRPIKRKRIDWRAVGARREVVAEVVRMNRRTGWFLLPDGKVIKRKLTRDVA